MTEFAHQRHKAPLELPGARDLIVVCPQMRSNVNLSRIVRAAGCSGVRRIIVGGNQKVDPKIARDALDQITIESRRSLPPVLKRLREDGFQIVGLEQATNSQCLYGFPFERRTVLVIGHERLGIEPDVLTLLDRVVEIPVYGHPLSFNAATAASMAMYEYCRQRGEEK